MGAGRFFGSSVHSSHVFSGRLASHLPCMGPPTSLVWGDRGGPPPYTDAPPPYKAPLHCLLYYWPPHMEPSWALLHHHLCRDASSSSTFILSQSPRLFWGGPSAFKGFSCNVSCIIRPYPYMEPARPSPLSLLKSPWQVQNCSR